MAKHKKNKRGKKPPPVEWRFRPAPFKGIDVALVGNGPSAAGKGAEIDAKPCVIRCNTWPDDRGSRTDIWVFFGAPRFGLKCPIDAHQAWFPLAPGSRKPYKVFKANMINICAPTPVICVEAPHFQLLHKLLARHPSTGFMAFSMALWLLHPASITLYGFDAMTRADPGWGHAGQETWQGGHNFPKEKLAIATFQKTHLWLWARLRTKVIWPQRPEGVRA